MMNYFMLIGKIKSYEFHGVCGIVDLNVDEKVFSVTLPTSMCEIYEEILTPGSVIGVKGYLNLVINNINLIAQKIITFDEVQND